MSEAASFDPKTGEIKEAAGNEPEASAVMSLDDARAMLVRVHQTAISTDDPLLMSVTLHQGFIRDYQAMLRQHDGGIKAILGATGEACAQAVETVLAGLKDKTVTASLEQAFALVAEQARNMDRLDITLRRHRRFYGFCALVCVTACALSFAILFAILR